MATPFPGMDPYLEQPRLWRDLHNAMIAELRRALGPAVQPKYYIRLQERMVLDRGDGVMVGMPDLTVEHPGGGSGVHEPPPPSYGSSAVVTVPLGNRMRETWLTVHDAATGEVVTVLEILSPANKRSGDGRDHYERKRLAIFDSVTSLVEIDLLRAGRPMPVHGTFERRDYCVLESRGNERPRSTLHTFSVRNALPRFRLPLRNGDVEPQVELRAALDVVYDTAGYALSIDYRVDPVPPLPSEDAAWADTLLRQAGKR